MELVSRLWITSAFIVLPILGTTVSVTPGSLATTSGGSFSLDVVVSQVTDLYSFQIDLDFTPGILSAVSVNEGPLLPSGGTTSFIPGTIDNSAGTISFNADTLIGSTPGVSGNGTLLSVEFQALLGGTTPITISNLMLLDSTLSTITATSNNGNVTVQAVPEPGTVRLIGIFILALFVARKISKVNTSCA